MQSKFRKLVWSVAIACLLVLLGAVFVIHSARAQTPTRPAAPGQAGSQPFSSAPNTTAPGAAGNSASPSMPVPQSVVDQAKDQNEGLFGPMVRPVTAGQIQEAWDYANPEDGVYEPEMCGNCTYRIRARERMVTLIELPQGEKILGIDRGLKAGWKIEKRDENRFAIQPVSFGYDTSLIVRGVSGQVYPFYIRAEAFNSANIPDLYVRIKGVAPLDTSMAVDVAAWEAKSPPEGAQEAAEKTALPPLKAPAGKEVDKAVSDLTETNPNTPDSDFVAEAPFDPNALRGWGEYDLWGDDELRPVTVFRDDYFTYIRYGEKWKDLELPTAYVVVDGVDELVNTRVQGQTFIIESTQKLITLKSGMKFLCIEFVGEA